MGRTAKAYLHRLQTYTIETDIYNSTDKLHDREGVFTGIKHAVNIAEDLWDYRYPFYFVDKSKKRLVYLHEGGLITSAKGAQEDIEMIANDLHPSAEEKFDTVDIIDEDTGKLLNTIHNADLIGILQAVKEVMER